MHPVNTFKHLNATSTFWKVFTKTSKTLQRKYIDANISEEVGSDVSAAKNIFSLQSILEYI